MTREITIRVSLPLEEIEAIIDRAVGKAFAARGHHADGELISATRAARLVHRRTGDVLAALESGALKGKRRGRRWVISPEAARAWAKRAA